MSYYKVMDLNDYWIGDTVRIRSSEKIGTFEGIHKDGRARIKYNGKILLIKTSNIESHQLPVAKKKIAVSPDEPQKKSFRHIVFQPTIDLHIEVLNPALENQLPQMILNHQIVKCKEHIEKSISQNIKLITIIHGKGTGQLKREVDHILSQYEEVRFTLPQRDGGATEVWLK